MVAAVAVTAGVMALYIAKAGIRSVVSMLALSPIVFVALFLFVSPASSIVFPDDVAAVELEDLLDDAFASGGATADTAAEPATIAERVEQRFPPIHLLVFDELPMASLLDEAGEIDRARWPNFARLADTAHLFSNATTTGFTTERAIPSMLTARYETQDAPVYSLYPENLFTLLGDIYDVSSSDPLVDLCPPSICNGAPPQSLLDLLATDEQSVTTATNPAPITTTTPPNPATAGGTDSSFRLLLDDTLIVFGHLAIPDGLDFGLPSIGSTWGDFGGDSGGGPAPPATLAPTEGPSTPSATAPRFDIEVGQVPADDVETVDAYAVNEANSELLDGLLTDDSRVADFRAEVAAISDAETPRLHYLHTLLPHVPWRLHPGGETYADIELPGYVSMWDDDPTKARAGQQRHLLQTQFADRMLGEYLDQLEREGIFEDATVIVVADHGVSFVPGNRGRNVGVTNLGGIAGVPLFYKLPNQTEPERHHEPVETIDIVPTIAAEIDIEIPWPIDGVDLFGPGLDRVRALRQPFDVDVPEPFPTWVDEVSTELRATFGNGETGSLYGLAGLHDRIGDRSPTSSTLPLPTAGCSSVRRPCPTTTAPPASSTADSPRHATNGSRWRSRSATPSPAPRSPWTTRSPTGSTPSATPDSGRGATIADIGLHEIVDDRLRPIPLC